MLEKVKKHIFISLVIAAIIYLTLIIYADFDSVINSFTKFNWLLLPLVLILSYLNYTTRFVKWNYYLRLLKIQISLKDSFAIFMSGLIMSVTPGKVGELLKSYLIKEISGEPISKTAPIVLVERITDFISVILLAIIGAFVFNYGIEIIIVCGIVFILLVVIISNKTISLKIIDSLEKIIFIKKYIEKVHIAYESSYQMLQPKPLFNMLLVSLFSWFFECFGFYLILINFGLDISIFWATFVYAFATIIGSISMLPGGLGVTDGSLTYLIIQNGTAKEIAVAATFIIRAVTLWFALIVGVVSVLLYKNRFGNLKLDQIKITGENNGKLSEN